MGGIILIKMARSKSIPKKVDFIVKQGDTFRRVFAFDDGADTPLPVDQSTATFKFIIDGKTDLTLGNGIEVTGDDNELVTVSKDIDWAGEKLYEFERVMDGITWTPCAGKLISKTELTED